MGADGEQTTSLSEYRMEQSEEDSHCYSHGGYSIKLSCGSDDTVTVDHWLDLTGNVKPCVGSKMAGEPLIKNAPWELALRLFNGDCVWNPDYNKYGKLSAPLPSDGFPRCDFTGASIRRLSGNNTNTTAAPTPPPTPPPTVAPTPAPTNATDNTTNTSAP